MKKYTSRATKWFEFFAVISAVMLLIGSVSIVADFPSIGLKVGFTLLGALMTILFLCCFLAERSRWLMIDTDKIVLPRGVDINSKTSFKRTIIKVDEITSLESKPYNGNSCVYTLKLKNGTKISFYLYAYGKEAEKEIIETIKKSV